MPQAYSGRRGKLSLDTALAQSNEQDNKTARILERYDIGSSQTFDDGTQQYKIDKSNKYFSGDSQGHAHSWSDNMKQHFEQSDSVNKFMQDKANSTLGTYNDQGDLELGN